MDRSELLERYEAAGDERYFHAAKPLYERALEEAPDAEVLRDYGYLLQSYGRSLIRRATELYERGIELDQNDDKLHYQLISTRVELLEVQDAVRRYEQRAADAPGAVR